MSKAKLRIEPRLRDALKPLDKDQLAGLRQNLIDDGGAIDPILIWPYKGQTIIDGMHRYPICEELGLPYTVRPIDFDSLDDAEIWIIKHQHGQRNETPQERQLSLGRLYNLTKKTHGGTRKRNPSTHDEDLKTSDTIAAETGTSRATVERAGKFDEELAGTSLSEAAKRMIRHGEIKANAKQIAALVKAPKPAQKAISKQIESGQKTLKESLEASGVRVSKPKPPPKPPEPEPEEPEEKTLLPADDFKLEIESHVCPCCRQPWEHGVPKDTLKDNFGEFWKIALAGVKDRGCRKVLTTLKAQAKTNYPRAIKKLKGYSDPHGYIRMKMHEYTVSAKSRGPYCGTVAKWLSAGRYEDDPAAWDEGQGQDDPRGNKSAAERFAEGA